MSSLSTTTPAQLLVVDDEPYLQVLLSRWLRDDGHVCARAGGAADAWAHLQQQAVDLVTLDIRMPGGSGLDLLDKIKETYPDTAVLMVSGEGDMADAIRALTRGAFAFLMKPTERFQLLVQVRNGLERRRLVMENREYVHGLEELVEQRTFAIRQAHEETIHRLVKASLYRDEETGEHIQRTGWYSELLAAAAGWDAAAAEQIRLAAPMHDVGKIGIPDAILRKPGKLTPDETAVMRTHTLVGAKMLAGSTSPVLRMAEEIALRHHERWDGSGYPDGLAGTEIPEAARIVALVDAYDALSHDRVYRQAFSEAKVAELMLEGRGAHFDPRLFDLFLSLLPEMRAIAQAVPDADANSDDEQRSFAPPATERAPPFPLVSPPVHEFRQGAP